MNDKPKSGRKSEPVAFEQALETTSPGLSPGLSESGLSETLDLTPGVGDRTVTDTAPRPSMGKQGSQRLIGRYRTVSLLGEGGMGEVYLARDPTMHRFVALKLLPSKYTLNEERVLRFKREATAVSVLNHPNVVTVFEVGQSQGDYFLAAEYVEGRTLRQILQAGPMPIKDILEIGIQITDGLEAAHSAGVIHRDLKPENIMIRPDGYVKILDFGLAKLTEPLDGNPIDLRTEEMFETATGIIIGTTAYMSPEQAMGQGVDHRSDIFGLAVVLYEMVTGVRPFQGKNAAAVCFALVNDPPAPLPANPDIPHELNRVLMRALEKSPELRYQTAADFRADLKRVVRYFQTLDSGESGASPPATGPVTSEPRSGGLLVFGLVAVFAAVVGGALFWTSRNGPPAARGGGPKIVFAQLTDGRGGEEFPSLSPDGKFLVYAGAGAGNSDIWWQRVGGNQPTNLTSDCPAADTQPAFSPNGELIAFRSDREGGGIFVMGATGESVKRLTDDGFNPAWSPDGTEIAFAEESVGNPSRRFLPKSALWSVRITDGEKRRIFDGDAVQPSWSPTGKRIAFWALRRNGNRDVWTIPAAGGEPVAVTDDEFVDWNPVWSPDGRFLYFSSDRGGRMNLWRIAIDEATGRPSGAPEPFGEPSQYARHAAFSADGKHLVFSDAITRENLQSVAFDPVKEHVVGQPAWLTHETRPSVYPDVSPDGKRIVFTSFGAKREDLLIVNGDGTNRRYVTEDTFKDRRPRWSPDGQRIAFFSGRSGVYEVWIVDADGGSPRQATFTGGGNLVYPFWSPDGKRLAYTIRDDTTYILDIDTAWKDQTPIALPRMTAPGNWLWACSWSPDGKRIAGWKQRTGSSGSGIVVFSFETQTHETLTEFGYDPVWLSDGKRIAFHHQGKLYLTDIETRRVRELSSLPLQEIGACSISRDDRMICFGVSVTEADIWMATTE